MVFELYPWAKALHVISVISWMAGLFYLPRLFVYHTERGADNAEMYSVFQTMERKLYRLIMTPAMISTWVFGLVLALTPGVVDWSMVWPWLKAAAVLGMTWFHFWCGLRLREFEDGSNVRSGRHYRLMNEVPTALMVVIVVLVFVRPF